MFERLFQWTIRNGTRTLFGLALTLFVFGAITHSWNYYRDGMTGADLLLFALSGIVGSLSAAMIPLTAAILIERFQK
jgi:hypothetical protein